MRTVVERIKPGVWFEDGCGRKMMKVQDILPSGYHATLVRYCLTDNSFCSNFSVNAIDDKGCPCCCPYGMEIFTVKSKDDLYCDGKAGPTVRHPLSQELLRS